MAYKKSSTQYKKEVELLAQIHKLEQVGGMSQEAIATQLGISVPSIRNLKSRHSRVWREIENMGVATQDVKMAWLKSQELSVLFYNPEFNRDSLHTLFEHTVKALEAHSPSYMPLKASKLTSEHCLMLHPTDMHIGSDSSLGIEKQAIEAISKVMVAAKPFNISQIVLTSGGDLLHFDNPNVTTTKGTHIQSDGSSLEEIYDRALRFYVTVIENLAKDYPLHFVSITANHDDTTNLLLSKAIQAWFRKHPNVTFHVSDEEVKSYQWGETMLSWYHGHRIVDNQLPMVIAQTAAEIWGKTRYRYAFLGHLHHNKRLTYQSAKEMAGLQLEWLKSVGKPDHWHKQNGFMSLPAVQSFIFSKKTGEVARFTNHML